MSGKTPNLDKLAVAGHAVHRLLRRGELHGGPGQLHHRRDSHPHRPDDRRPGRRRRGHAGAGLHARHRAEGAGLCHRAVRQEPPRRPEQVPADGARLRRVLRLPVPPRRDVGPVLVFDSRTTGLLRQVRPAQPGALLGDRHGRPDRDAALGQGRQAEDRGRRPAAAVPGHVQRARTCRTCRRRPSTTWTTFDEVLVKSIKRLHGQGQEGRQAVLRLAQHDAHARLDVPLAEVPGDDEQPRPTTAWKRPAWRRWTTASARC